MSIRRLRMRQNLNTAIFKTIVYTVQTINKSSSGSIFGNARFNRFRILYAYWCQVGVCFTIVLCLHTFSIAYIYWKF
ncbi:hypothetical protein MXB_2091 [Myxobolus squamalis]|nr:hypothetical protein MXB_2091 [Myxobolus squamalis]